MSEKQNKISAVPVSKEKHHSYRYKTLSNFIGFKKKGVIPFCIAELHKIVNQYPIAFTKSNETYTLVFLTSFIPDKNLYIDKNGLWVGKYVPAILRSLPFVFSNLGNETSKMLCYLEEYRCVLPENSCDNTFIKMFEPNGEFSDEFKKHIELTETFSANLIETNKICNQLSDENLIVEWPIKLRSGDEETDIKGLFKIDENKIISMSENSPQKNLDSKLLYLAYGQIFSKNNLEKLVTLHTLANSKNNSDTQKSLRDQVVEKQKEENTKELDQLVKNLIADE